MNKINMTPRERQMRRREALKEYVAWGVMMFIPIAMVLHWVVVGY